MYIGCFAEFESASDCTGLAAMIESAARRTSPCLPLKNFKDELFHMLAEGQKTGNEFVEINAGELHRRVGGYPGRDHRMPNCCQVMKGQLALDYGDSVVDETRSGQGAALTIRYRLPRREEWRHRNGATRRRHRGGHCNEATRNN